MTITLASSRVLIVDDNEFNRKSLALVIRKAGITSIEFATDGVEGLAKTASFKPDLILLDVAMPNMDGIAMCRALRDDPVHAELPILFQTALDSDEEQVACFGAGGSDFISKPIKPGECVARVRHHLERRRLFQDLSAFRARVERELTHAKAMQMSLLPETERLHRIAERYALRLHWHFETSSELGGDLWTAFEIGDRRVGFLLVDFAGHGITAAINTFRLHTLIERVPASRADPAAWLGALNLILKDVLPTGQFATALYAVLDTSHNRLTYAAAGSPPPLLGGGHRLQALESSGRPLGISRQSQYQNREIAWPVGSSLFLYSDALTECLNRHGGALGEPGVLALAERAAIEQPENPLDLLLNHFFSEVDRPLRDDLTAVWIGRQEDNNTTLPE